MAERVVKVRLTAQISEYQAAMVEAANKTRTVGTEAEKLAQKREAFQALGSGLLVVGGAMTALTLAVAKTGIEYNTLQQTSRAALTTLLGSAEAANAQMDRLDEFARTSPFAKSTFITAQQQMLAFGIEAKKVIPYLDSIQDAVAAAGGGNQEIEEIAFIMAQISSASKITGQDLLQFGQRGINAAELIGSQMGKTGSQIKEEITAGTLGADEALEALAGGMAQKFDGAAENVKDTFAGALDRVKAAWRDLSSDLMTPLVDPSGGGALVDVLNWAADMMRAFQALPEPIKLTGGAMFALAGFIALVSGTVLVATPRIAAMRIAFMELSATMRGIALVGGGAILALTALVAVVGAVSAAQAEAQAKADAYADTLEDGTNRVTSATREMAKEALAAKNGFLWMEQDSAYDAAEKLGISLELVTDAATGNVEAMKELQQQIDSGALAHKGLARGSLEYANSAVDIENAVKGESESIERAIEIAELKQQADRNSAAESGTAAEMYQQSADAVSDLNSQLVDLIDAINEANGVGQDAVSANASYQSALSGVADEVQRQRDAFEEAHGTLDGFSASLDQSTASGSANASMLADVAGKAQDAALAAFEQDKATMSVDDATKKYSDTLAAQRQKFIDSGVAAGFNKTEVVRLADQVFKLPSSKEIKILAETAAAQSALDNWITTNSGRQIRVKVTAEAIRMGSITATANAAGGLYANGVKSFAGGGMEPGIYPYRPGGIHKFAEEYDEGYVSMDPRRRAKSEGVWTAIGKHMGFGRGQDSAAVVASSPDVYVQNPFTGEYLLAQVSSVAGAQVKAYDESANRASRGGVRF